MSRGFLVEALRRWTSVIGGAHVVGHDQFLAAASRATFATSASVLAILRPANRDEVQACVRIANEFGISLNPISTGKNWGYGLSVPVEDGVLLDLGRLNRIVAYDEALAYVTIEPGVTQRQLHEFLRDQGGRLWMDATGASPDCSIVGNTMERGFGHTPMGDHCGNVCGLEVVLPTGECIETGFGRFGRAKSAALSRWGVGPSLDGLFTQSNFGIVTRMSVWLMPAPESFLAFFFACEDDAGLPAVIDALRPLRLNGTLRCVSHIGNDYKVIAATGQFPWDDVRPPLDRATMAKMRARMGMGVWNGSGALYGTKRQVREGRRLVRQALKGKVSQLHFISDRLLEFMAAFATPLTLVMRRDIRRTLKVVRPVFDLLKGVPTDSTLASAYWRKREPAPVEKDPDRDGCGLLWCSPVLPNTGADAAEVTRLATDVLLAHGFEPQISLSLATERTAIAVITISYDREVPGEDERASACYHTLLTDLLARGYPAYRVNVGAMGLVEGQPAYAAAIQSLKDAWDPGGILSPDGLSAAPAG